MVVLVVVEVQEEGMKISRNLSIVATTHTRNATQRT